MTTSMFLILSLIFISVQHTLFLAMLVILLSLSFAMKIMMKLSTWLGVLILLLYSGGILVVFLYITALSYNPIFFDFMGGLGATLLSSVMMSMKFSGLIISNYLDIGKEVYKMYNIFFLGKTMFLAVLIVKNMLSPMSSSLRPFTKLV